MRVPLEWLHEYCEPHMDAHTLAQRLALTGTEVERVEHHGVLAPTNFVVGHVLERQQAPGRRPAERLHGRHRRLDAVADRLRRPERRRRPDGRRRPARRGDARRHQAQEGEAARRSSPQGMILVRARVRRSVTTTTGSWSSTDGSRPGLRSTDVLQISTDVLVLEITPNRPDCLGIYGVAREVAPPPARS